MVLLSRLSLSRRCCFGWCCFPLFSLLVWCCLPLPPFGCCLLSPSPMWVVIVSPPPPFRWCGLPPPSCDRAALHDIKFNSVTKSDRKKAPPPTREDDGKEPFLSPPPRGYDFLYFGTFLGRFQKKVAYF